MAYEEYRTVSVRKAYEKVDSVEPIALREGDHGAQIIIAVENNGQTYPLPSAANVKFKGVNGAHGYFVDDITKVDGNIAYYTVSTYLTEHVGRVNIAYLEITQSGDIFTTDAIPFVILPNAESMKTIDAQGWQSAIDEIMQEAKNAYADIGKILQQVESTYDEAKDVTQDIKDLYDELVAWLNGLEIDIKDPTVSQTLTTYDLEYAILAKETTETETCTEGTRFCAGITINPATRTVTADTFSGNASTATSADSATTAQGAEKLISQAESGYEGTDMGDSSHPVYFEDGVPEKCGDTLDVDISGNASTADEADKLSVAEQIGDTSHPVYFLNGVPELCTDIAAEGTSTEYAAAAGKLSTKDGDALTDLSVGSESTPVYFAGGVPVPTDADIGDESTPVFMKAGVLMPCETTLPNVKATLRFMQSASQYPAPGSFSIQITLTNYETTAQSALLCIAVLDTSIAEGNLQNIYTLDSGVSRTINTNISTCKGGDTYIVAYVNGVMTDFLELSCYDD